MLTVEESILPVSYFEQVDLFINNAVNVSAFECIFSSLSLVSGMCHFDYYCYTRYEQSEIQMQFKCNS
jgi:hypothetical protein